MAQLASASGLGPEGPVFESQYPDLREVIRLDDLFFRIWPGLYAARAGRVRGERNMVHRKSSAPTKELGTNPGACLCDGCIGKKVIAKLEIITNLVSTSKTQSTTYSEISALHKELT